MTCAVQGWSREVVIIENWALVSHDECVSLALTCLPVSHGSRTQGWMWTRLIEDIDELSAARLRWNLLERAFFLEISAHKASTIAVSTEILVLNHMALHALGGRRLNTIVSSRVKPLSWASRCLLFCSSTTWNSRLRSTSTRSFTA